MIWLVLLLCLIVLLFIYFKFFKKAKIINYGSLLVLTGGIKVGKTITAMKYIDSEYSKSMRLYNRHCRKIRFLNKFFKKNLSFPEMPLIYSNVPLGVPYVQFTLDMLQRKVRMAKGSVVYLNEINFLANQWDNKDYNINVQLNSFCKLFGHEMHSDFGYDGLMIVDTQNVRDMHYAFKNCISSYMFLVNKKSFLHFWFKIGLREFIYAEGAENNVTTDAENDLVYIYVNKRYFKYYDCANMSIYTDNLTCPVNVINPEYLPDLKSNLVVSINPLVASYFKPRDVTKFINNNVLDSYNKGVVDNGKKDT